MQNSLNDLLKAICNNEQLMKFYAQRKCKQCIGKGYIDIQPPGGVMTRTLCACVSKKAKKEIGDG